MSYIGLFPEFVELSFLDTFPPISTGNQKISSKKIVKKCGSHFYRLVLSVKGVEVGLDTENDIKRIDKHLFYARPCSGVTVFRIISKYRVNTKIRNVKKKTLQSKTEQKGFAPLFSSERKCSPSCSETFQNQCEQ